MILLDTHVLLWWIDNPVKLSKSARKHVEKALHEGKLAISAISVWEIGLLSKRKRITLAPNLDLWINQVLSLPELSCLSISPEIALVTNKLNCSVKDPADRMIIATAQTLHIPLVTADERIRKCQEIETIW